MNDSRLQQLENDLGYTYKNKNLLLTALTHRSYLNEGKLTISNERLEFLGDAVLELAISEFLYNKLTQEPEGILTSARSAIVRTESLAQIAQKLKLGDYLLMSHGEEKSGGRTNTSLLANTTEAIIGSIFLDSDFSTVKTFINNQIIPAAQEILKKPLKDAKSLLQERVQEMGYLSPLYLTTDEEGPDHNKIFTVEVSVEGHSLATGQGKNKQIAQQTAAKKALDNLANLPAKN